MVAYWLSLGITHGYAEVNTSAGGEYSTATITIQDSETLNTDRMLGLDRYVT